MPILQKESDNADIPNMSDQRVKLAMEVRIRMKTFNTFISENLKYGAQWCVPPPPVPLQGSSTLDSQRALTPRSLCA